jgi:superfamily I DNA/RNA helicase/RecB family exonuclease
MPSPEILTVCSGGRWAPPATFMAAPPDFAGACPAGQTFLFPHLGRATQFRSHPAGTVRVVDWTPTQQQVLGHQRGWLQALGAAGTGKTSVLAERWRQGAASGGSDRVLVLCRSRDGADRFRRSALGARWWAGEDLPFTTLYGMAFDLVRRHRGDRRLLTRAEQWSVVRRVLARDGEPEWPSCPDFVRRAAFIDEVGAAVLAIEEVGASDESVLAVAEAGGVGGRWADLVAFRRRYRKVTDAMEALDGAQLLTAAAGILADPQVAAAESARWDEVLIDDAEGVTSLMGRLIERLAPERLVAVGQKGFGRWFDRLAWPATVRLDEQHRTPLEPSLIRCRHPSTEPDAIAAVLLAAREEGVPWRDMAVLVRSERQRAQSIGRALTRHDIPVRVTPGPAAGEPAVRAVIDFFAWTAGDHGALDRLLVSPAVDVGPTELRQLRRVAAVGGSTLAEHPQLAHLVALHDRLAPKLASADPAELAHEAWVGLLGGLVPDPDGDDHDATGSRALDSVVTFLAGVSKRAAHDRAWRIADELALVESPDFDPDPWVPLTPPSEDEVVTVTTVFGAAGRAWDTVVVAGCLEGEFPRVAGAIRFFDRAVAEQAAGEGPFSAGGGLPSAGEGPFSAGGGLPSAGRGHWLTAGLPSLGQRRQASLEEERRLFAGAVSRARRRLVATAAPAPGQLVSRFVAAAPLEAVRLSRPRVAKGTVGLSPASQTEGLAPIHLDGRLSLSASRLMTYDDCPRRYFYQYTLGVRGPGGVAASMGTVVHEALAKFLDPAGAGERDWAALESLAQSLWIDTGLSETIAPYQPMRDQARRDIFSMLEEWWRFEAAQAEATGAWPDVVAVEYPFDITVAGHRVRGTIDRVDRVPGGLAIIDYKTGSKVPKPEEVAEDLQLATYHLAALQDPWLAAIGPPVSLQLSYLRKGVQPSQAITAEHSAHTEQRIVETANRILAEDFEPSVAAECDYCEFWQLCPLQIQGRQVGPE